MWLLLILQFCSFLSLFSHAAKRALKGNYKLASEAILAEAVAAAAEAV